MRCVARHAEWPLGFGLLGETLQVIAPNGLISARPIGTKMGGYWMDTGV
jgi:hypothetical protein